MLDNLVAFQRKLDILPAEHPGGTIFVLRAEAEEQDESQRSTETRKGYRFVV